MTLEALSAMLPNGLHDAQVSSLRIDYIRSEATLEMKVWIGDSTSDTSVVREAHRAGSLVLSGLSFCCIEPPDARYPYQAGGAVTVDTGKVETLDKPPTVPLPINLSAGTFTHWFFVNEWNSFIYVAATHAEIRWSDEAEQRISVQVGAAENLPA